MISISKTNAFKNNYNSYYINSVVDYLIKIKGTFSFFNYTFNVNDPQALELLKALAYDPFDYDGLNNSNMLFLKCYNEIAEFLLYSRTYFEIFKETQEIKKGKIYLKKVREERESIVNKFFSNHVIQRTGWRKEDVIKSQSNYYFFYEEIKNSFVKNNKSIAVIFNYDSFLNECKFIRNDLLSNINLAICPYCNRQYIDTYSYAGKVKSIAQIDHFYPKKTYPLYSLSLLNFVPSCSHCNCIIKKDRLFPWKKIYQDDVISSRIFNIDFKSLDGIFGNPDFFNLRIDIKDEKDKNNSIFFRHESIYQNHKNDISDLLKKRVLYNNAYKYSLENCLTENIKYHDFKKLIFGVTGLSDDFAKIPLSKLKNDIIDELGWH